MKWIKNLPISKYLKMLKVSIKFSFSLLLMLVVSISAWSQKSNDLALLATHVQKSELPDHSYEKHEKKKLKVINAVNPVYWVYKGGLAFYQSFISEQISSTCIYETSCSRFSKKLFDHYGPFKGLFLSSDRVSRCNRLTYTQANPLKLNSEGKIIEHVEDFSFSR